MALVGTIATASLLSVGIILMGLAGIGLMRLPDAYTRMNAAGKAGGLGVACIVAGSFLAVAEMNAAVTAIIAIVLQLLTVPIGSVAIAQAAYRTRTPLDPKTAYDDLAATGHDGGPPA